MAKLFEILYSSELEKKDTTDELSECIKKAIEKYINITEEGHYKVEANKLKEILFRSFNDKTVFISHSHKDEDYIYSKISDKYKNKVFMDGKYWQYSQKVIDFITKEYGQIENFSFIQSNINMMLMISLSEMINKCKHFIFVKSPESIENDYSTYSPWIYYELKIASILNSLSLSNESLNEAIVRNIDFNYDVHEIIKNFEKISFNEFKEILKEN